MRRILQYGVVSIFSVGMLCAQVTVGNGGTATVGGATTVNGCGSTSPCTLANGSTTTTQVQSDGTSKLATDLYVDTGLVLKLNANGITTSTTGGGSINVPGTGTFGTVAAGTVNPAALANGCPAVLTASQVCVTNAPFYASGYRVISTATASVSAGATSMTLTSVAGFSVGQTMRINGTATTGYVQTVTISATAGNLVTFAPAVQVAATAAPTVWTDGDTSTVGTTSAGPSVVVANASTYAVNQGVYISGAAAFGADYVGTITAIAGNTLTLFPATSTSISSGALVRHDDTAAFQAAINLATVANPRIDIIVPDGHYNWNGPTQSTSSGSSLTAIVKFPVSPYLPYQGSGASTVSPMVINIAGQAQPSVGSLLGSVIQSDRTGTTMLSGDDWFGFENDTNVEVNIKNLIFRTYDNPNISAINLVGVVRASVVNSVIDTGLPATCGYGSLTNCTITPPTHSTAIGIRMPKTENEGGDTLSNSFVTGYYADQIFGEHTVVYGGAWSAFAHDCFSVTDAVHPFRIDSLEAEYCTNGLTSLATEPVQIFVLSFGQQDLNYLFNDPQSTLLGTVNYGERNMVRSSVNPVPPNIGAFALNITIPNIPSSSITPNQLPGLVMWFKADSLLRTLTNGASVTSWPDSSGNGNTAFEPNYTVAPTFVTNQVNGYPAVKFSGAGGMNINNTSFNGNAGTFFYVYSGASFTNYQSILSNSGAGASLAIQFGAAAKQTILLSQTAVIQTGSTAWTPGTWYQANAEYDYSSAQSSLNLGVITSSTIASDGTGTTAPALTYFPINCLGGQQANCSSQPLNGSLAEVFFFNRTLSTEEITAMETYLYNKYGNIVNAAPSLLPEPGPTYAQVIAGLGYAPANCISGVSAGNCLQLDGFAHVPVTNLPYVSGTTGSIGGTALAAGQCATGTASLSSPESGHPATASESNGVFVGGNYTVHVTVSGATATVYVCAIAAGTPSEIVYNVQVF